MLGADRYRTVTGFEARLSRRKVSSVLTLCTSGGTVDLENWVDSDRKAFGGTHIFGRRDVSCVVPSRVLGK